ncbi:MAG: hypothetical protein ACLQGT_04130 [Terracidiphilus sp.]
MRRLILLAFAVFLALPAFAAKGMTVEQLEQALDAAQSKLAWS